MTRFKRNAALHVEPTHPIEPAQTGTIRATEIVRFHHYAPDGERKNYYTQALQRIMVARSDKATPLVLASNELEAPATRIAERYEVRWQIALFCKWSQ